MKLDKRKIQDFADIAVSISRKAGSVLLSFYKKSVDVKVKSDGSPLTAADKASHYTITELLARTRLPVVSEEAKELPFDSSHYWLIDPLDGTKDFLAGNDHFTVNIALIYKNQPVLGVVYAPALDELYVGIPGSIAWQELGEKKTICRIQPKSSILRMAISYFHDHPDTLVFAAANDIHERIPIGSALKYGRLAMGEIDVYPRLVGTSEWDTAAGQAVLEASGGSILDWQTLQPLSYGKNGRRNNAFIAFRTPYLKNNFILLGRE